MDRHMIRAGMSRNPSEQSMQEIAATCLYIAAKIEEIYPPTMEHFSNTPEEALTVDQLLTLEREIINSVGWNCTVPTSNNYLGL
mmetsp:Transcript_73987/g.160009  ORF Transcript_73987/g.160009 Transcript_73987/m.160009 type:complete len:84 (-) Transcript_73987:432-683(-)